MGLDRHCMLKNVINCDLDKNGNEHMFYNNILKQRSGVS